MGGRLITQSDDGYFGLRLSLARIWHSPIRVGERSSTTHLGCFPKVRYHAASCLVVESASSVTSCHGRNLMRRCTYLVLSLFCLMSSGCAYFRDRCDADLLSRGRVLVLSGIETPSIFTSNIATGIAESGWNGSVEIHDWRTGHFHNFAYHLMDVETNRQRSQELSDKIVTYQDQYPDAPVHLVGHSGGAGIIVMALEALLSERQVTTATLLASALSPDHDLSIALARTSRGMWHYHSPGDFVLCEIGRAHV